MVRTLLGQKKSMRQVWTAAGRRMPVTEISVGGNAVTRVISVPAEGEEGATRVQIGFGPKKLKNMNNAQRQLLSKSGLQDGKRWFRETEAVASEQPVQAGQILPIQEVFQVGDVITISGTIKGRGFAGVVKRHGFAGGPKTHGQSDRQRAPGSIGNRTDPGRVFPGKRMPGHYGVTTETLENRVIVAINPETQTLWVKGTLPGAFNGLLTLEKKNDEQNEIALNEASLSLLGIAPAQPEVEEAPAGEAEVSEAAPETAPEAPEETQQ
jgi:large subunit ribosomal protein L3